MNVDGGEWIEIDAKTLATVLKSTNYKRAAVGGVIEYRDCGFTFATDDDGKILLHEDYEELVNE